VTVELAKPNVVLGGSVTGSGHLVPGIADTPVFLVFVKPDGSADQLQVTTLEKGSFSFAYTPDVVGNWTVAAWWQSDRGYYSSAYSEKLFLEVKSPPSTPAPNGGKSTGIPVEYIFVIITIILVVINIIVLTSIKRAKKSK
jgi:hypothetical protein